LTNFHDGAHIRLLVQAELNAKPHMNSARTNLEGGGDRGRVVIDNERYGANFTTVGQCCIDLEGDIAHVLGTVGGLDRNEAATIQQHLVTEHGWPNFIPSGASVCRCKLR
jgi:hypothetical protein